MREVTIPNDYNPFVVWVNNVEYFYKAGETVEVPDEVAEVIDRFTGAKVPEPEKLEYVEGFSYDPVADAGKVLQIRDDGRGIEWGEGSGGGGGGSSQLDEWLGVTDLVTLTINLTMPESVEPGGRFAVNFEYYNDLTEPDYASDPHISKYVNTATSLEIPAPLINGKIFTLSFGSLEIPDVGAFVIGTVPTDGATYSGGAEFDESTSTVIITGDATLNLPVLFAD